MPPAQWRERLLALLAELIPRPPASVDGQRALERLRTLIDDFARQAANAGFESPVPLEVVRAHFTARLGEADTRAPLLTGGVSFARMVPMRLLPFRVICLLGMNDGDFPRRDAAAGLNRLTAELGTDQRRHGDRSTRDDDRYLFLQLFSAAQDVFYVSWLGADARDGSVREPSALVTELLAHAGRYHAEAANPAKALVLRHALQPFSPTAYGAGDARFFSYRAAWQPAAGRLAGSREALPRGLMQVLRSPPGGRGNRAVRRLAPLPAGAGRAVPAPAPRPGLAEREEVGENIEPLNAPARGLERHALQHAVFEASLAGHDVATMHPALRARGLLPAGPLGFRALEQLAREMSTHAHAFAEWRGAAQAGSQTLEVQIDDLRLHGRLADVMPQGIVRLALGKPSGRTAIRNGLDWLLASAAGIELPFVEFHDDEERGIGPHVRPPLARIAPSRLARPAGVARGGPAPATAVRALQRLGTIRESRHHRHRPGQGREKMARQRTQLGGGRQRRTAAGPARARPVRRRRWAA